MVAILECMNMRSDDEDPNRILGINQGQAFQRLKTLKCIFKAKKAFAKLSHSGVVEDYPESPLTLQQSHPEVFRAAFTENGQEVLPAPYPFDELVLDQVRARLPARSTHQSIGPAARDVRARTTPAWQDMLAVMGRSVQPAEVLPGLQIFGSRDRGHQGRSARALAGLRGQAGVPALADVPLGLGVPAPADVPHGDTGLAPAHVPHQAGLLALADVPHRGESESPAALVPPGPLVHAPAGVPGLPALESGTKQGSFN